jgi:AAA15 family ATPase/GTPase
MYLRNLLIDNFKNFNGHHRIHFQKGLNIINGSCGSGKTNLCFALEYLLFGNLHGHISNIINIQHEQATERDRYIHTEIELDLVINEKTCTLSRDFYCYDNMGSKSYNENTRYNSPLETKLTRPLYHELICIQEGNLNKKTDNDPSKSVGQRIARLLLETAENNISHNINLMILDDTLPRLDNYTRKTLLHKLLKLPLEQITLLETNTPNDETLQKHNPRTTQLNTRMEKTTLSAVNFPLPAKNLEENTRYFYDGAYLNIGDKFHRDIHDHEYYLEVIEAIPNGARFDTKTELTLTNG